MSARRQRILSVGVLALAACTPRTQSVGQVDSETSFADDDGGATTGDGFTSTPADEGAETVTVGYGPECPSTDPDADKPKSFSFAPTDGSAPVDGTAQCTVVPAAGIEMDCTGDLVGRYGFQFEGSTPALLFTAGTTIDVTHRAAGESAWLRFAKGGYTMIVVQADRLAPTGISIDEWLPGVYAGLQDAFCDAVTSCPDDLGLIQHVAVWLSDTPDAAGPTAVTVFPGESGQLGGDTYFEIAVESARQGECGVDFDQPQPTWVVYQFEGPFPI